MNILKIILTAVLLLLTFACDHPIELIGDGDVTSATGTRNCYLADARAGKENCTKNTVVGAYNETYYAVPHLGWKFVRWSNYCEDATTNECSFNLPADLVNDNWGATVPPLVAVFSQIVVPVIHGTYTGTYNNVVTDCNDSSDNGTYLFTIVIDITSHAGTELTGSAIGTINLGGITAHEIISISGTIEAGGSIRGTSSHTFFGTTGEGTFTGQLTGNTLTILNKGQDSSGDTCRYIRDITATRNT